LNEEHIELAKHWIKKAYRTLETARYNLKGNFIESSLDRLYYASFYSVMAYLTIEREKFKKHSGVKSFFFRNLVKKGIIDKKYGKLYNKLYYLREEADYTPNPSFSYKEVENLIKETENFIKSMENIINQKIKEMEKK